jgi:hypothetical protein
MQKKPPILDSSTATMIKLTLATAGFEPGYTKANYVEYVNRNIKANRNFEFIQMLSAGITVDFNTGHTIIVADFERLSKNPNTATLFDGRIENIAQFSIILHAVGIIQ